MNAPPAAGLPSWCPRLISTFEECDARAKRVAADLTSAQLNWQPQPGAWSIGQCIDHLANANDVYLAAIERSLAHRSPDRAVDEIVPGLFGRWFIRNYIEPSENTRRAKAPKKIVPASAVTPEVLDRLLRGNERARQLVRRAAAYDVNRVRFTNPFIPIIRFTVGTGLEVLSRHERRHLLQAERVRETLARACGVRRAASTTSTGNTRGGGTRGAAD